MAKYSIEEATLKGIADSIRGKEGTTDAIPVANMAARIEDIPTGDTALEDAIIEGTLTEYTNSRVTKCGGYLFAYSTVSRINFPAVDSIPEGMCYNAKSLTVVDMLGGGSAGDQYFSGCSNLSTVLLRNEKSITACKTSWYPFAAYVGNSNITRNFTRAQWNTYGTIGRVDSWSGVPQRLTGSVTYMMGTVSNEDKKPVWMFLQYQGNTAQQKTIAFVETEEEATALMELYEQQYNVESKYRVCVPRALLEQYKASTGWKHGGGQIRAIEDYTVDGTTTGALDESKL